MVQQGQVVKLKTKGADGKPLWAYRYGFQGHVTKGGAEQGECEAL